MPQPHATPSGRSGVEAFDLSKKGSHIPYFRRQMAILWKLRSREAVDRNRILETFSKVHRLTEELECLDYVCTQQELTRLTPKGRLKLKAFLADLPEEDRAALDEYTS